MRYFGGKQRIANELTKFINENYLKGNNRPFVDLFCGSCNIISKIGGVRQRIANDRHKYLIAMWQELQKGWIPPKDCTKEQYYKVKDNLDIKPYVSGFIGFGCSFAGIWFSSYASSNEGRNYCKNAFNSTMKKTEKILDVLFTNSNYDEVSIPKGSIVYCDIPYKNTSGYSVNEVGKFNHDDFYSWVNINKNNYTILISEYEHNLPEGFKIVWKKESKQSIRNKENKQKETVEILMTPILNY